MAYYTVRFVQPIWNKKETDKPPVVYLGKVMQLPFAPFVGLEVSSANFHTSNPILRVVWHEKENEFWAYCPDNLWLRELNNGTAMDRLNSLHEIIALYKSHGWEDAGHPTHPPEKTGLDATS